MRKIDELTDQHIRTQTAIFIKSDEDLGKHVEQTAACVFFLDDYLRAIETSDQQTLILDRLCIRSINSIIAALWLLQSGLYQPSLTMVRDVIETTFLLDLFSIDETQIGIWTNCTDMERQNKFSPSKVRKFLDKAKGQNGSRRDEIYKRMCKFAAHPDPDGFVVISPDGDTKIGPFPNFELFKACMEEIAKHAVYLALTYGTFRKTEIQSANEIALKFFDETRNWVDKYLLGKHPTSAS